MRTPALEIAPARWVGARMPDPCRAVPDPVTGPALIRARPCARMPDRRTAVPDRRAVAPDRRAVAPDRCTTRVDSLTGRCQYFPACCVRSDGLGSGIPGYFRLDPLRRWRSAAGSGG